MSTLQTDATTTLAARMAYGVSAPKRRETPGLSAEEVVRRYAPLVYRIAKRVRRRTGFLVDLDDLVCEGTIGLLQAAERFDPSRALDFEHLASVRVQGAMLDSLRRLDPLSQRRRREARRVRSTEEKLATALGRPPTAEEMARALGMELDDYHRLHQEISTTTPMSIDDMTGEVRCDGERQDARCEDLQRSSRLKEHIEQLPEKQRLVLSLVYFNELSQKEVAQVLGVTEARVSQLHKEALERLRKRLRGAAAAGDQDLW